MKYIFGFIIISLLVIIWGYTPNWEDYEIEEIKEEVIIKTLDTEIDRLSIKYSVASSTVRAIARCESAMYGNAINHNKNGTIDKGYLQINSIHYGRMTELGLSSESEWNLLEFGFMLMAEQGLQPWSASKHCWSSKI
jgi:hypothetical protein